MEQHLISFMKKGQGFISAKQTSSVSRIVHAAESIFHRQRTLDKNDDITHYHRQISPNCKLLIIMTLAHIYLRADLPCRLEHNVVRGPNMNVTTRTPQGASGTVRTFPETDPRPLHELFGLTTGLIENVVFITIDFENLSSITGDLSQNLDTEVGLAILDTGNFDCIPSVPSAELIRTYNFVSGSSNYQERPRNRSLFGKSATITQDEMLQSIKSLIPRERHVILVGHAIQNELRALHLLNFDFSTYNKMAILDTQCKSFEIISWQSPSLYRLLITLGCPFRKLHCGGNDANFALKALLLLAIRNCNYQPEVEQRLALLKDIALNPLPEHIRPAKPAPLPWTDCEVKAMRRRAERLEVLERSRKQQSKLWDDETIMKIRAERAARRLARAATWHTMEMGGHAVVS